MTRGSRCHSRSEIGRSTRPKSGGCAAMTSPLQPPSPPPPVQAPVKKGLIAEFREFINKGNVIDLAVAVVLGAAFTNVVNSVVNAVLNPLLAAVVGKASFEDFGFDIGDSRISIGTVIDAA